MGGKHRRLLGGADAFADDTVQDFRAHRVAICLASVGGFGLDTLKAEQARLEDRLQRFGACPDAVDIWTAEGVPDAASVPGITRRSIHLARRQGSEDQP